MYYFFLQYFSPCAEEKLPLLSDRFPAGRHGCSRAGAEVSLQVTEANVWTFDHECSLCQRSLGHQMLLV